ncbi:hypothetical protein GCM10022226_24580 [Sphaerisporangium flaviroseum]|uniref:Uncharacterized protein n=1 Tax=Sphaerisporangium flaviroseum TaxID=509199 RepID=A0ABP7HXG4_9ACTN
MRKLSFREEGGWTAFTGPAAPAPSVSTEATAGGVIDRLTVTAAVAGALGPTRSTGLGIAEAP